MDADEYGVIHRDMCEKFDRKHGGATTCLPACVKSGRHQSVAIGELWAHDAGETRS